MADLRVLEGGKGYANCDDQTAVVVCKVQSLTDLASADCECQSPGGGAATRAVLLFLLRYRSGASRCVHCLIELCHPVLELTGGARLL